jgi:hypothetical protein
MKNGKELSKDVLLEAFGVDKNAPLYGFAKELANWIVKNVKEYDIKELCENYCYDISGLPDDELIDELLEQNDDFGLTKEDLIKIKNKEYRYYEGSASDEEGGLEGFLCDTGINIDTYTIKIKSGGSY